MRRVVLWLLILPIAVMMKIENNLLDGIIDVQEKENVGQSVINDIIYRQERLIELDAEDESNLNYAILTTFIIIENTAKEIYASIFFKSDKYDPHKIEKPLCLSYLIKFINVILISSIAIGRGRLTFFVF